MGAIKALQEQFAEPGRLQFIFADLGDAKANYTIITHKCKGPQYSADLCCPAFKEFACPYIEQLNDHTSDCASTMFSYINLYGKYPPGLFAYECREGKKGLDCQSYLNRADFSTSSANMIRSLSPVIGIVFGVAAVAFLA